jgi:hypothetical protein
VLDGCGVVDAEYGGEVVAGGEGFVKLAVGARPFEGGVQAAEGGGEPVLGDGAVLMAVWLLMSR